MNYGFLKHAFNMIRLFRFRNVMLRDAKMKQKIEKKIILFEFISIKLCKVKLKGYLLTRYGTN